MRKPTLKRGAGLLALVILLAALWALPARAEQVVQRTFASPEEAMQALLGACMANSIPDLLSILGPGSRPLVESGDSVSDANGRQAVVQAAADRTFYHRTGESKVIVNLGFENWPLPIPLVMKGGAWRFDAAAGVQEVLDRRVGANELQAIKTLQGIVEAQGEYYSGDLDGNGVKDYAASFGSRPGTRSGLYWPPQAGWPESPAGPLVAEAESEGYTGGEVHGQARVPHHGYYFRVLKEQGPHARGGAYRYPVNGNMVGGFAVVAWPAEYGNSGLTTFLVNANGVIWQKDLGWDTSAICEAMSAYDPDRTWAMVK